MEDTMVGEPWVSVTYGIRGYFATMMANYTDGKITWPDHIQSSPISHKTQEQAEAEAKWWAGDEELRYI